MQVFEEAEVVGLVEDGAKVVDEKRRRVVFRINEPALVVSCLPDESYKRLLFTGEFGSLLQRVPYVMVAATAARRQYFNTEWKREYRF